MIDRKLISDEQTLDNAGVRVTAVRLLVIHQIRQHFHDTFSLSDLETALPTVDRSTLFRTLTTLRDAHLLHETDDGSGAQKYCLCQCADTKHHHGHVHLTCRRCHRTFCLTSLEIPSVPMPEGFEVEETEYIVKGVCKECRENGGLGT